MNSGIVLNPLKKANKALKHLEILHRKNVFSIGNKGEVYKPEHRHLKTKVFINDLPF